MASTAQHIRAESSRPATRLRSAALELTQLRSGSLAEQSTIVPLGNVWLAAMRVAVPLVVRGRAPSEHVTLLVVEPASSAARIGLRAIDPGRCALLGRGAQVDLFLPAECRLIAVSIADRRGEHSLIDADVLCTSRQSAVLAAAPDALAWLLRWTQWIVTRSVEDPHRLDARSVRRRLRRAVLKASRRVLDGASVLEHDEGRAPLRQRAVMLARDLLREQIAQPLGLEDLCCIAQVGARTLEYGFRELYGMSPIAYIRCERLCRVHDELLAMEGAPASISRTASRWGFAHMSQFAKDYRTLFGESPSSTLHQRPRPVTPKGLPM